MDRKKNVEIKLTKENHECFGQCLWIKTIYRTFALAHSCYEFKDKETIMVDESVFIRRGLNPCQVVNGFVCIHH